MPDNVSFDQGAMLAGVVMALNGFELMAIDPAKPLAVIGVGAMGLAVIATAQLATYGISAEPSATPAAPAGGSPTQP
jgi:threonine dehydrogenase-like Zn-dependent dehydrogenase